MRELTADLFVSLDGFASGTGLGGQFGPESKRYVRSGLNEPQLLIMGRVTYKILSSYWPSPAAGSSGFSDPEFAPRMNSLPKLVFSNTLQEPLAWNNTRILRGDLADEILALKTQPGDPIRSIGSINLVKSMMKLGLIDRLRLFVFPIVLGSDGKEPIFEGLQRTGLELIGTTILDS